MANETNENMVNSINANYLYSVGISGFARLNIDGSLPTPQSWEFKDAKGTKTTHKGGLIGKANTYEGAVLNDATRSKIYITFGQKKSVTEFKMLDTSKTTYTTKEVVDSFNKIFTNQTIINQGITLKAELLTINGKEHIRIYDSSKTLPFYAPIGVIGYIPSYLGFGGYITSEDVKSIKTDFEKESGKSVDITSGRGIRCVVKESDKIKGMNLTISMAGVDRKILSLTTGQVYDITEDIFYVDTGIKAPLFAFTCFVKAFLKGENNESSFEKVKLICCPCCQTSLPGENLQEGAFSTVELQASCSQNRADNLPIMFYRNIPIEDYNKFIEEM